MNLSLRRSTSALLASSLLLTIGRGATLPFMTIYLSRQYSLSVDLIGYAMTIALTIGVVFSLGFGILADKFDKKRYMLLAITAFASGFIAIPLVNNVTLVVLFFALINCAYSVFATVLKAWFADNPQGNDPRFYMRVGMDAMKEVVRNKITVCGSADKLAIDSVSVS